MLFNLENVSITNTLESRYIKPFSIDYTLNGIKKIWDLIQTHNSVSIIIYNSTRKVLIFVRQFRPGVYYNSIPVVDRKNPLDTKKYPPSLGVMIELCAGIIDKDKPVEEIAQEECGYHVPLNKLRKIKQFRLAVGFAGDDQTMFYAEVTDDMKVSQGGGLAIDAEFIEVVEMTLSDAKQFFDQEVVNVTSGCLFGVSWFFSNVKVSS